MLNKGEVVSETLLKRTADPGIRSDFYKSFCLGLLEWCPCCTKMEQPAKSLQLKQPRVNSSRVSSGQEPAKKRKEDDKDDERFPFDVTFEDLSKFKEGECPINPEKNTEWAFHNFKSWHMARN